MATVPLNPGERGRHCAAANRPRRPPGPATGQLPPAAHAPVRTAAAGRGSGPQRAGLPAAGRWTRRQGARRQERRPPPAGYAAIPAAAPASAHRRCAAPAAPRRCRAAEPWRSVAPGRSRTPARATAPGPPSRGPPAARHRAAAVRPGRRRPDPWPRGPAADASPGPTGRGSPLLPGRQRQPELRPALRRRGMAPRRQSLRILRSMAALIQLDHLQRRASKNGRAISSSARPTWAPPAGTTMGSASKPMPQNRAGGEAWRRPTTGSSWRSHRSAGRETGRRGRASSGGGCGVQSRGCQWQRGPCPAPIARAWRRPPSTKPLPACTA